MWARLLRAFGTSFEDSTLPHVGWCWFWLWLSVAGVNGVFEVALVETVKLSLVKVTGAEVVFASSVLSCCQKRSSCEEGDDEGDGELHLGGMSVGMYRDCEIVGLWVV